MSFVYRTPIRFAHCDPAGIVFYPRYFEMMNAAVEDWFAKAIGVDFAAMHLDRRLGTPTVSLSCEFLAPARLGEELEIAITVNKVGSSSCEVDYLLSVGGETRATARGVLVCMSLDTARSTPWPDRIRKAMEPARQSG